MKRNKRPVGGRRSATNEEVSFFSVLKSTLLALPIAATIGVLLMLLTTALLLSTKNPDSYHTVAGLLLLYLTALTGGAVATRLHHRRTPLFCGLLTGALYLLVLLILSFILPDASHTYGAALSLGLHALLLPAALVGALAAAREKRSARRPYRAR